MPYYYSLLNILLYIVWYGRYIYVGHSLHYVKRSYKAAYLTTLKLQGTERAGSAETPSFALIKYIYIYIYIYI